MPAVAELVCQRYGGQTEAVIADGRASVDPCPYHLHGLAEDGGPDGPGGPLCARCHAAVEDAKRARE